MLYYVTTAKQSVLEELNQDVWMTAIESIGRFDISRGTVVDWILGIARHKGLTFLRRHYTNRVVYAGSSDELPEIGADDDDHLVAAERVALIRASLESLPANWQYALRQKYQLGVSVRDIAQRMDSTPKAIESILSRARHRLREIIRESSERL